MPHTKHLTPLIAATLLTIIAGLAFAQTRTTTTPTPPPQQAQQATAYPSPTPVREPVITPTLSPPVQVPPQGGIRRNLADYLTAPTLNIPDNASPQARSQVLGQVRAFVWQQWQAKRRARSAYLSTLRQGFAPGTTTFYVEPDASGRWRITREVQGEDTALEFYFVEEIVTGSNGRIVFNGAVGQVGGSSGGERRLNLKTSAAARYGMVF